MRRTNVSCTHFFAMWCCFVAVVLVLPVMGSAGSAKQIPVDGMVTMVDLGAKKCIPCKMMAPILVELEDEYEGRAAIHFIDVWENPGEAKRFGIRVIPTQIFYDREGKEISRHEGFMAKKEIVARLQKLGV